MDNPLRVFHGVSGGTVFVDPLRLYRVGGREDRSELCRIFTLPGWTDDLHAFGAGIGLRRAWFESQVTMPHYLLTRPGRQRAVDQGVVQVSAEESLQVRRIWREERINDLRRGLAEQRAADLESAAHRRSRPQPRFLTPMEVTAEFAKARRALATT